MEQSDQPSRPLFLMHSTKAQRMLRIKDAWEKIQQAEQGTVVELDVKRATVLAEALGEEVLDGKIEQKDLVEATGISQPYLSQMLLYNDFRALCASMNIAAAIFNIPEGRFRQYWKQMSDPHETRGKRDPEKKKAYNRRVFLSIIEWLEAGKDPMKPMPKPGKPKTVEQIVQARNILTTMIEEMESLFAESETTYEVTIRLLGADRATYAPTNLANHAARLKRERQGLLTLITNVKRAIEPQRSRKTAAGNVSGMFAKDEDV